MIKQITSENKANVMAFFNEHWGSTEMVISSGIYKCENLDGFIAEDNDEIVGLITYVNKGHEIEIISLDSVVEGKGIGSALIEQIETVAQQQRIHTISLVTTNDNLHALKFYQKRGYRMTAIIPNAVNEARKIKATIPLIGNDGIPLHDEIVLKKQFK